jgi:hypothetical protein
LTYAFLTCFALLFPLLATGGCKRGGKTVGPPKDQVSGTVTYDGSPLIRGQIIFVDKGDDPRRYGGDLIDGKFSFECTVGEKEVVVQGFREGPDGTGDEIGLGGIGSIEQYLPARYNESTELTAEVVAGEENVFNFDLESGE